MNIMQKVGVSELLSAAVAMSLYQYNVSPGHRAERLYEHFEGNCAEPDKLLTLVDSRQPTALVYLSHALIKYGDEAAERVYVNGQMSLNE